MPDIQKGKEISMSLLSNVENPEELGNPEMIKRYFAKEEIYTQEVEKYQYKEWNSDLVTMLSTNRECRCTCLLYTSRYHDIWEKADFAVTGKEYPNHLILER